MSGEIQHGSLRAYSKYDCRCDLCRENWNSYMRWWRAEQRGRLHSCPSCTCEMPTKPLAAADRPATNGGDRG